MTFEDFGPLKIFSLFYPHSLFLPSSLCFFVHVGPHTHCPWSDCLKREGAYKRARTQRTLITNIRKRQSLFLGHIMRKGQLENLVTTGKLNGKKGRGRPQMSLVDNMRQWLAPNINTAQLIQRTQDKDLCHQVVTDIRTEHDTWRDREAHTSTIIYNHLQCTVQTSRM